MEPNQISPHHIMMALMSSPITDKINKGRHNPYDPKFDHLPKKTLAKSLRIFTAHMRVVYIPIVRRLIACTSITLAFLEASVRF